MIKTVRVTSGQEKILAKMLKKKAEGNDLNLYSVVHPEGIKGYIFVEVDNDNTLAKLTSNVKHVKGSLDKELTIEDIKDQLEEKKKSSLTVERGDTVEITSGPWKGDRAKVVKRNEEKDELTVELVEVAVPISVELESSMVKLYKKEDEEE